MGLAGILPSLTSPVSTITLQNSFLLHEAMYYTYLYSQEHQMNPDSSSLSAHVKKLLGVKTIFFLLATHKVHHTVAFLLHL